MPKGHYPRKPRPRNLGKHFKYLTDALNVSTDECQVWPFFTNPRGYGMVCFDGQARLTHRVAQKLTSPNFDESACYLHRCDNPPCFNPRHTFPGTRTENNFDMFAKGRNKFGNAKIKPEDVKIIREISSARIMTRQQISEKFGIKKTTVQAIIARTSWTHID